MEAPESGDARMAIDTETNISHYIHSVELKGSRAQKLQALDALIAYLEQLRRSLGGNSTKDDGAYGCPSPHINRPARPWLVAGAVLAAGFLILLMAILVGVL